MTFKNVKEALQMMYWVNTTPQSLTNVTKKDKNDTHVHKQTYSELQELNREMVVWLAKNLGMRDVYLPDEEQIDLISKKQEKKND